MIYRSTRPWIIFWGIGLHLIYAGALLVKPEETSSLLVLVGLSHFVEHNLLSERVFGMILGSCALMALAGFSFERRLSVRQVFALIAGQYFFMVAAFISDAWILASGYRSAVTGEQIDRVVVFVVLGPIMWAALLHTICIYQRYAWRK